MSLTNTKTCTTATKANTPHACYYFRRVYSQKNKFIANNCMTKDHLNISSLDLAPSDYQMFPVLRQNLGSRHKYIYRVSQEEWTKLRKSVPYVELHRYNPKHLYPKLNGYGDNGQRKVWASGVSTYCTPSVTPYSSIAHARQLDTTS